MAPGAGSPGQRSSLTDTRLRHVQGAGGGQRRACVPAGPAAKCLPPQAPQGCLQTKAPRVGQRGSCCLQTRGVSSTGQTQGSGLAWSRRAGRSQPVSSPGSACAAIVGNGIQPGHGGGALHRHIGSRGGGQGSEDSPVRNGRAGVTGAWGLPDLGTWAPGFWPVLQRSAYHLSAFLYEHSSQCKSIF